MNMIDEQLLSDWVAAKKAEQNCQQWRREIEDILVTQLNINEQDEGSGKEKALDYEIKYTCRHNRKIDSDKLQEIANEQGLNNMLGVLFKWKPEISASAWKAADPSITDLFLDAITVTPVRTSFTITKVEK